MLPQKFGVLKTTESDIELSVEMALRTLNGSAVTAAETGDAGYNTRQKSRDLSIRISCWCQGDGHDTQNAERQVS